MRILLLSTSYNSLTQAAHVELQTMGHEVSIEVFINPDQVREGIALFKPDLILCPMLTKVVPDDIWQNTPCIIVHPGIRGDRGPSSLDWAILEHADYWGVTAVSADYEMDSGAIWASAEFAMRDGSKSSIYRDEVVQAAMGVIRTTVKRIANGHYVPEPLDYSHEDVHGRCRPLLRQTSRHVNWQEDPVEVILRKVRSADGAPGLLDTLFDEEYFLCGAHPESTLVGTPGEIIATREGAICIAANDGAVWITHLKKRSPTGHFKQRATDLLAEHLQGVPEKPLPALYTGTEQTFREIWYEESGDVGYLHFDFYNGAMSTRQCERLTTAYNEACQRPIKTLVLMGGRDYWSNGIHLNVIEAANDPATESWANINAINDLVQAILLTRDKLTIAAIHGSAGAGGVMLALAADRVFVREGVVLNPHYRSMGGLYGSEFWTWSLPRRVGEEMAESLTQSCLPLGAEDACKFGLVDGVIYRDLHNPYSFRQQIERIAEQLSQSPQLESMLTTKVHIIEKHADDMLACREMELAHMHLNFFGEDRSYHEARTNFVLKRPATATPDHLAIHRQPAAELMAEMADME
ncbi:MAG: hydrogenase maturation protein [Marinobacterium sp.]|nr:hydrogenase maturation protein [Marinobacterium sp.]